MTVLKFTPTKPCEHCGVTFVKNPKYSRAQWARARFCSNACHAAATLKRPLCACGCGERVIWNYGTYRQGHNPRSYIQRTWIYSKSMNRWYILDRNGNRVLWYRVVMQDKLGRPLRPGEVVHHIDGDSTNDAPENLQLFASNGEHLSATLGKQAA